MSTRPSLKESGLSAVTERIIGSMAKSNMTGLRGQPCFTPAEMGMGVVSPAEVIPHVVVDV
jgi:hypothetical protein